MQNNCKERQAAAANVIRNAGLDGIVLEDTEGRRNSLIRYLTGLPRDGLFFVFRTGGTVLVPWDLIMAQRIAVSSKIIPLTDFERRTERAIQGVLDMEGFCSGSHIELQSSTPYPLVMKLREQIPGVEFSCPERGIEYRLNEARSRKDEGETACIRKAADITNEVLDRLASGFEQGEFATELEAAAFIEHLGRKKGAEGMGFETIAAGPRRSFGIHALPSYTAGPIGTPGLSIIDFGFTVAGYTSDVTVTLARGNLSRKQEHMIELVNHAYNAALKAAAPGARIREICKTVEDIFASEGFSMPHSLGHGIGLDAHEAPLVSTRAEPEETLEPGMVITLEPGLYADDAGGVRLENDVLITETGAEVLTRSRILRLP